MISFLVFGSLKLDNFNLKLNCFFIKHKLKVIKNSDIKLLLHETKECELYLT